MSQSARVTSIEALEKFRTSLGEVELALRNILVELNLEYRRVAEWIEQTMPAYWPAQARKASDRLTEALHELERCQTRIGSDEAPSCYEQKKAVERARRRLRLCEEKTRIVRKWKIKLAQEATESQGNIGGIANYLDADIPRALVELEQMVQALRRYSETR